MNIDKMSSQEIENKIIENDLMIANLRFRIEKLKLALGKDEPVVLLSFRTTRRGAVVERYRWQAADSYAAVPTASFSTAEQAMSFARRHRLISNAEVTLHGAACNLAAFIPRD